MRRLFKTIAVAVFFMAAFYGCSGGGDTTASKEPTARIGDPAPSFTVEALDGRVVRLEDFRGRPLVLAFMAGWCPCSKESAPVLKEAYSRYHPKGVEFMVLGFQDSRSKFRKFIDSQSIPFPAAYDDGDKIGVSFGVNAPPTTFFITPEGRMRRAYYGKITEIEKLSGWIDEVVPKEGPKDLPVKK